MQKMTMLLTVQFSVFTLVHYLLGICYFRVRFGNWKLRLQLLKVSDAVTVH